MNNSDKPFDINSLDSPDFVGACEYRAIHEVLESVGTVAEALDVLDEFVDYASGIRLRIRESGFEIR